MAEDMKIRNTYIGIFSVMVLFALLTAAKMYAKEKTADLNNDQTITRQIEIEDFDKIDVSQGIHLVVIQKENPGVAMVKTTPGLDEMLRVETVDGCLKVYYDNGNKRLNLPKDATIVTVDAPTLKDIEISSASSVVLTGQFNVMGNLKVEASSSAKFFAKKLSCTKLDIEASSASEVSLGEFIGDLDVETSSASKVEVKSMRGKSLDVEASSASSINFEMINCQKIDAEASSASKITLAGACRQFNKEVSSGARIIYSKLAVRKN